MREQLSLFDIQYEDTNKLSSYEQKLIIDNQGLIIKVLKDLSLISHADDLYDLGVIALIEAINSYNESKGTLSTYIYNRIKWAVCNYLKHANKDFLINAISISDFEDNEESDLSSLCFMESDYNLEEVVENREKTRFVLDLLNNKNFFTSYEKEIFCNYFGFNRVALTRNEMAEKLGVKPATVNSYAKRIMNKLQKLARRYYGGEYE